MSPPPPKKGQSSRSTPPPELVFHGGIRLAGELLAFDSFGAGGVTVVSHAHVRIPTGSGQFIASHVTARLLGAQAREALATPFHRSFSLGELELNLQPSGHIPGSAALRVRYRNRTLLFAGQFNPTGGLQGEELQVRRCHTLVLDAVYGEPRYRFPPPETAFSELCDFCRDSLGAGQTPVLVTTPLGKAQELMRRLTREGFKVRAHRRIYEYTRVLFELGVPAAPVRRWEGTPDPDDVVVWPLHRAASPSIRQIKDTRFALVSGQAADPESLSRFGCTHGIALSDHADFDGLLRLVREARPRRVLLPPGPGDGLVAELVRQNVRASVLGPPEQMDLFGSD